MKILCISDHIDPILYSDSLRNRFPDIDLILSAGDLPLNYYDFIATTLNKPLMFVFGNHNLKRMHFYKRSNTISDYARSDNKYPAYTSAHRIGGIYIGDRIVKEKELLIGGLGGTLWYNGRENQYTEVVMYIKILKLLPRMIWNKVFHHRFIDILLTHTPPYGINDRPDRCHTGFKAFLWFIKAFKPKYLIHGHVHLYDINAKREAKYRETTIINVYKHYLIDFNLEVD